jgi:hypothetical protein
MIIAGPGGMLRGKVDGITTLVTWMSHDDKEIRGDLIGLIARQCCLKGPEFWDLIDCPLSKEGWDKLVGTVAPTGEIPSSANSRWLRFGSRQQLAELVE